MEFGDPESKSRGETDHTRARINHHLLSPFIIIPTVNMEVFSQKELSTQNNVPHEVVIRSIIGTLLGVWGTI